MEEVKTLGGVVCWELELLWQAGKYERLVLITSFASLGSLGKYDSGPIACFKHILQLSLMLWYLKLLTRVNADWAIDGIFSDTYFLQTSGYLLHFYIQIIFWVYLHLYLGSRACLFACLACSVVHVWPGVEAFSSGRSGSTIKWFHVIVWCHTTTCCTSSHHNTLYQMHHRPQHTLQHPSCWSCSAIVWHSFAL